MLPAIHSPFANVKAFTFDVFGTVVNWNSSVTEELVLRAHRKKNSVKSQNLKSELDKITNKDWFNFALEWRGEYGEFTSTFNPQKDAWKTVDQELHDSLVDLLKKWNLTDLYTPQEVESLSLVWHRLRPWSDSPKGIRELNRKNYTTAMLSNGNRALLCDLNDYGDLGFEEIISAEDFKAYKPKSIVYEGAAKKLGLKPEEIAMVAAHLYDLEAARSHGYKTVYIERELEESWPKDGAKYKHAKKWVDLWISEEENGIETLASELKKMG